jgi:hypothetical protein
MRIKASQKKETRMVHLRFPRGISVLPVSRENLLGVVLLYFDLDGIVIILSWILEL